jgi:cell division protein FtsL
MEIAAFVVSCIVAVWAIISTLITFNQNRKIEELKITIETKDNLLEKLELRIVDLKNEISNLKKGK